MEIQNLLPLHDVLVEQQVQFLLNGVLGTQRLWRGTFEVHIVAPLSPPTRIDQVPLLLVHHSCAQVRLFIIHWRSRSTVWHQLGSGLSVIPLLLHDILNKLIFLVSEQSLAQWSALSNLASLAQALASLHCELLLEFPELHLILQVLEVDLRLVRTNELRQTYILRLIHVDPILLLLHDPLVHLPQVLLRVDLLALLLLALATFYASDELWRL